MNNNFKKNSNDIPLTDLDYEGVIYEPSDNAKKLHKNLNKNKEKPEVKPKEKIKKAPDFNFSLFFGFTIIAGVIIFILVFAITFSSVSNYISGPTLKQDSTQNINTNNIESELVLDSNTNENILGIIKNIDYETKIFTLSDIKTNKIYTLKSTNSSIFKDKYDNMLTISEVKLGTIVDFSFDSNNKINYIKENTNSFSIENASNVNINLETNILKINNRTLKISEKVSVVKNSEAYDLSYISKIDVIDIKGYDNTIYFIDVRKGNGTLKLINKPNLNNAVIEIDRDIYKSLDEIDSVSLSEGKHKVIIRSSDSISFIKEIDILSDTETELDLSQIQYKSGTLIITSNVSDYSLYVNNVVQNSNQPLNLTYGSYSIRIEKQGYHPFQTQIAINSSQKTLNAQLEKIEKTGKITISSTPDNAEVFIDNILVGYTPLTYTLAQGVHSVTLKKSGYNDFILSSITVSDEESSFNITMHKSQNTDTTTTTESTTTESTTTESTTTETTTTEQLDTEPTI